ncbi:MAG: helix-turn-helix domain-containing protein [Cellulosilyticaceae bacterium]
MIEEVIHKVGVALLKPIKEQLPETISYTAIKLVIAKLKAGQKQE